jgi:hypothetical protein
MKEEDLHFAIRLGNLDFKPYNGWISSFEHQTVLSTQL